MKKLSTLEIINRISLRLFNKHYIQLSESEIEVFDNYIKQHKNKQGIVRITI